MRGISNKLALAKSYIEQAEADLSAVPEKEAIHKLIQTCELLDERYKEFCAEFDEDDGLGEGTTYNNESSMSIEFYIEAADWHEISKALRELKN